MQQELPLEDSIALEDKKGPPLFTNRMILRLRDCPLMSRGRAQAFLGTCRNMYVGAPSPSFTKATLHRLTTYKADFPWSLCLASGVPLSHSTVGCQATRVGEPPRPGFLMPLVFQGQIEQATLGGFVRSNSLIPLIGMVLWSHLPCKEPSFHCHSCSENLGQMEQSLRGIKPHMWQVA